MVAAGTRRSLLLSSPARPVSSDPGGSPWGPVIIHLTEDKQRHLGAEHSPRHYLEAPCCLELEGIGPPAR